MVSVELILKTCTALIVDLEREARNDVEIRCEYTTGIRSGDRTNKEGGCASDF